jgi:hypothetical protein
MELPDEACVPLEATQLPAMGRRTDIVIKTPAAVLLPMSSASLPIDNHFC